MLKNLAEQLREVEIALESISVKTINLKGEVHAERHDPYLIFDNRINCQKPDLEKGVFSRRTLAELLEEESVCAECRWEESDYHKTGARAKFSIAVYRGIDVYLGSNLGRLIHDRAGMFKRWSEQRLNTEEEWRHYLYLLGTGELSEEDSIYPQVMKRIQESLPGLLDDLGEKNLDLIEERMKVLTRQSTLPDFVEEKLRAALLESEELTRGQYVLARSLYTKLRSSSAQQGPAPLAGLVETWHVRGDYFLVPVEIHTRIARQSSSTWEAALVGRPSPEEVERIIDVVEALTKDGAAFKDAAQAAQKLEEFAV